MQLSEIRNKVQSYLMDHDEVTDSLVNSYINDFIRQVCRNHNFEFMESEIESSTVDGQRSYTLPDGTNAPRFKTEINCELIDEDTERESLTKTSKEKIEEGNIASSTDRTETGIPDYYAVTREAIFLYPLPDHSENGGNAWTINLEYYGFLSSLSTDTDVNYLTNNNPWLLIYGATAMAFDFVYQEDRAKYYKKEAQERFQALIREHVQSKYSERDMGIHPEPSQALGPGKAGGSEWRWQNMDEDGWYS